MSDIIIDFFNDLSTAVVINIDKSNHDDGF